MDFGGLNKSDILAIAPSQDQLQMSTSSIIGRVKLGNNSVSRLPRSHIFVGVVNQQCLGHF